MTPSAPAPDTGERSKTDPQPSILPALAFGTAVSLLAFDALAMAEIALASGHDQLALSWAGVFGLTARPLLLLAILSQLLVGAAFVLGGAATRRVLCGLSIASLVATLAANVVAALHEPHDGVLASWDNLPLLMVVLCIGVLGTLLGRRYLGQPDRVSPRVIAVLLVCYVALDFLAIDIYVWRQTFIFTRYTVKFATVNMVALGFTVAVMAAWLATRLKPSRAMGRWSGGFVTLHLIGALAGQSATADQVSQHVYRQRLALTAPIAGIEPNPMFDRHRPAECAAPRKGRAHPCASPPASAEGLEHNLLFVTIDALRADRVTKELMPNLSELAERSLVMEEAFSPELTTGRTVYTYLHNTVGCHWSLAQVLKERGYHTFAVAAYSKKSFDLNFADVVRLDKELGRQTVTTTLTSHKIADRFDAILDKRPPGRFFAWVHLYDVHGIYTPNEQFDYGDSPELRYDAEVSYTDGALARLFDSLKKRGLAESTVVAVASDHGEEHFEHGRSAHVPTHYDEVARIPTIVHVPGLAPTRQGGIFTGRDFPRLLLSSLGPETRFTTAVGELTKTSTFMGCDHNRSSVLSQDWKLIVDEGAKTLELYDRRHDPGEVKNAFERQPERALSLWSKLCDWHQSCSSVAHMDLE